MHMHLNAQPELTHRLKLAAGITIAFVLLELAGGVYSHSLSVFSDAAQNFIDAAALFLVFWSQRLSTRPADKFRTFGYARSNVLVAFFNAAIIIPMVLCILYCAVTRFFHPVSVDSTIMGAMGLLGLGCNLIVVLLLRSSTKHLHVKGAYLHNMADLAGSILLVLSGVLMAYTHIVWIDLALAGIICSLVIGSFVPILRQSIHILLEGTPEGIDLEEVAQSIRNVKGVVQVHDLHAWTHGDGKVALTCHVCVDDELPHDQDHALVDSVRLMLREDFSMFHTTIQLEHGSCEQGPQCLWHDADDDEHADHHADSPDNDAAHDGHEHPSAPETAPVAGDNQKPAEQTDQPQPPACGGKPSADCPCHSKTEA